MSTSDRDITLMRRAIELAKEAGRRGNLPIGAIVCLDGKVVAEGMNSIWKPTLSLARHAEMEALRGIPEALWPRFHDMTLFTTLEPCLMCTGAILLHEIGRVVYGSFDSFGGSGVALERLPPYFQGQFSRTEWNGPVLPEECDLLRARVLELIAERGPLGQNALRDI